MSKACSRCGKCCTNEKFMGNLSATKEDVYRWIIEGRDDILEWVHVIGGKDGGTIPYADLWVKPETGHEAERCPFVRKDRGKNTYRCTIYETRPQACRDYVAFSGLDNDICEDVQ